VSEQTCPDCGRPRARNSFFNEATSGAELEKAWDDGLDFAGAALRGGCSLDEAANGNPHRKQDKGVAGGL